MRLGEHEFKAMNNPARRLLQRAVEFPQFKRLGLTGTHQDILEIGCGSGYGATLLATLKPRSYVGIDLMPEQVALAQKRRLTDAEFRVQDATDLDGFPDASKDTVVIFGVLHHIPPWRLVLQESYRVLRPGGKLFVEEPDGAFLAMWDRLFHWGHPVMFRLHQLEAHLESVGFIIRQRRWLFGFGIYCAEKPEA